MLLAGGEHPTGGQAYGSSDRRAEFPAAKTGPPRGYRQDDLPWGMGIDDLTATDRQGRPYNLLEEGTPLVELF